jgi:hypothetical protein
MAVDFIEDFPCPLIENYGQEIAIDVIRTQMECGRSRQRVRGLIPQTSLVSLQWDVTGQELSDFKAWLLDEVAFGEETFYLTIPIDGVSEEKIVRFTPEGSPVYSYVSPDLWNISAAVEVVQETDVVPPEEEIPVGGLTLGGGFGSHGELGFGEDA